MKLRAPKSIGGRLALGSALLVIAALVVASLTTGFVLYRFIRGQIDQRLDTQIASLATSLSSQADLSKIADPPPFDRPFSGWYWTVSYAGMTYRSVSLAGRDISLRPGERLEPERHDDRPGVADGFGPRREALRLRVQTVPVNGDWATITATAPVRALFAPLRDALVPVVVALFLLGLLLALASLLQLRLGLRPLARLKAELEAVRAGRSDHIAGEQPLELQPLVGELNTLIAQNAEGLRRARGHVANLGHALNTPLATLGISFAADRGEKAATRLRLVEEMQARIRHHLGRARAAALGGPVHVSTALKPRIDDIVGALSKIHADRGLALSVTVPEAVALACEPQDLDEMLGNLLDNAFKWAHSRVAVKALVDGNQARITVEDDGPGIEPTRRDEVLMAGRKLDESVPGHGFGLAITRELAELYGGDLTLAPSGLGGLRAEIRLPTGG